jgi:ribosomal protein S18 acetylase RimI-like enzyme
MPALTLEPARVPEVAQLLSVALHDDPAYAHIFPDAGKRRAQLQRFFHRYVGAHVAFGCTFALLDGNGALQGTLTLRPPGGIHLSAPRRVGMLARLAASHGPAALGRMQTIGDLYAGLERATANGAPHFHVHMMAVQPELQGRGLGSGLLREVLEPTRARADLPVVLTTHKQINVTFYRRAGFEVVDERSLRPGKDEFAVWCMRRGPQPSP